MDSANYDKATARPITADGMLVAIGDLLKALKDHRETYADLRWRAYHCGVHPHVFCVDDSGDPVLCAFDELASKLKDAGAAVYRDTL